MSHKQNIRSLVLIKHIKKKEPRHDLPLHKIPELLAKITLIVSSNTKQLSTSIDCYEQLFKHYSDNNH
ncbi:unnamed protein product [Rotaria sordida]|uniref:Uncharacterized protein n=1 Tax=Rotaria sordida TaxID=392033 RepID=A0A814UPY5_9BILA|nr:unnamed protein product [Rotaria sordida]CAF1177583.1 unnamed protein product [Rotaria sordida]